MNQQKPGEILAVRRGLNDIAIKRLFVLPTIILLICINIFPLIWSLGLSFADYSAVRPHVPGVNPNWIKLAVYVISGFTASLGGILLTARLWSAQPNAAVGWELDAIAAPVLGGVSLFGAVGGIGGTIVGAFIIGVLSNGLNLMGVPSYYQQVIKGAVFILAVMLDLFAKRRR